MTDDMIKGAARKVIFWKGYPFSEVEYYAEYDKTLKHLMKNGATDRQIKKFKQMVDSAPIRNGRFNRWSGD